MKKLLLLALLYPSIAFAANKTVYVNTDCANNGDGSASSCAASNGAAGAFSTLSNAISGEAKDLVTNTQILTILCRGTAEESGTVVIDGYTTSASYYIYIKGDPDGDDGRHPGKWSTSHYRVTSSTDSGTIRIREGAVKIEGIQVTNTRTDYSGFGIAIESGDACDDFCEINGVILHNTAAGATSHHAITTEPLDISHTLRVYNSVITGWTGRPINLKCFSGYTCNWSILNNTIQANTGDVGVYFNCQGTETMTVKNNVLQATADDYDEDYTCETKTTAKNITADATSPDGATYQSKTCTFVGSGDYHLGSGDTNCVDAGDDLSGTFTTDVDGAARSGSWDIGADEYSGGGGATYIPRRFNNGLNVGLDGGLR